MLTAKDLSPYVDKLNAAFRQLVENEEASSRKEPSMPEILLPGESTPNKLSPANSTTNSTALMYHQCRHKVSEASEALQEALSEKDAVWPRSTPDYKRIAEDTTRALDAVTRMLKADMYLLRSVNMIPAAEVEERTNLLRSLLIDAREKFGLPPSTILSIEGGLSSSPPSGTPLHQPPVVPRLFGQKPVQFHGSRIATDNDDDTSGDTSARVLMLGKGSHAAPAAERSAPAIDPSELYDARLMFPGCEWRSTEPDDQCEQLRQVVAQLSVEKEQLAGQVEELTSQLESTKRLLVVDADTALKAHEQVEADMRTLSSALGIPYGVDPADIPAPIEEPPAAIEEPPAAPASPSKSVASEGVQVDIPAEESATPQRPATTGTPRSHLNASALSPIRSFSPNQSRVANEPVDTPSNRYQRLERLYVDVYKGRGMEMVWNAVDTIYRCEYDGKLADATPDEQAEMYTRFQGDFEREVSSVINNQQAFSDMVQGVTPLRSDYVANCLSHRVKANSGVVTLLSHFKSDRAVRELSLQGNYIGDNGVLPLLPVLARMHNLTDVNLANNGIRNDGVRHLCRALASHPSVCRVDLSHNAIARAGGKDILSLVNTCSRIIAVELEGTSMDPALRTRIQERAAANADSK